MMTTEDAMDRPNPTTDLFTLIGMMATIAGILTCLFFLFTPATFGATEMNSMIGGSPDLHLSMRWIQPILGQAIVEDAVIRQRSIDAAGETAFFEGASTSTQGSVQWVLGRVIVELSRSRVVNTDGQRIVTIARYAAEQFQGKVAVDRRIAGRITSHPDLMF
jgi:hypothetical protein